MSSTTLEAKAEKVSFTLCDSQTLPPAMHTLPWVSHSSFRLCSHQFLPHTQRHPPLRRVTALLLESLHSLEKHCNTLPSDCRGKLTTFTSLLPPAQLDDTLQMYHLWNIDLTSVFRELRIKSVPWRKQNGKKAKNKNQKKPNQAKTTPKPKGKEKHLMWKMWRLVFWFLIHGSLAAERNRTF